MPRLKVTLYIRITTPDGKRQMCKPVYASPGRLKPLYAVDAEGNSLGYRPEGEYYLRYAGKWEAVGNDPYIALDRLEQRKSELRQSARTNGACSVEQASAPIKPHSGTPIDEAINEYLTTGKAAEKNWRKHTRQTYTLALKLFRESCSKTYLNEVDGDDLRRFKVFLRKQQTQTKTVKKRIDDRTVWNHFNNVVGFLNSYGLRNLIPQSEWPTYEEKPPEAYDPEDVIQLFNSADEDERDVIEFFCGVGFRNGEAQVGSPIIVRNGNSRYDLSDDIWIEKLDEQLAKNIQTACEPAHYRIDSAAYDRHLYAFVRPVPLTEKTNYEGMSELHAVIALSRLINPTSIGDRYCARVFDFNDKDSSVQAIQYRGSSDVFLSASSRDWLSVADGETLRKLMPWSSKGRLMHERIHRAYWNHENAMRSAYLDIRWTLVVAGFEALVNTKEADVAWQFRDRVRQLANEFNISVTDDELRIAYKLRSKLVHAQSFLFGLQKILPPNQHNDLYLQLESLLRLTVRQSLLDQKFGDSFRDAAAVNKRWKLSPNPNRRTTGFCRKISSIWNC